MINLEKHYKLIMVVGTIALWTLFFRACTPQDHEWNEEVQLSNGKVIVIERELVMEAGGDEWASNRSGSKPKEYRIQFADPSDSKKMIEWYSIKKSPQTYPEIPLILDVVSGQLVVFSSVAKAGGCQMYNEYRYQNGAWVEEKLPPTFEQRATNLFVMSRKEFKSFMDLKTKQAIIDEHRGVYPYARYDEVGPVHPNCRSL